MNFQAVIFLIVSSLVPLKGTTDVTCSASTARTMLDSASDLILQAKEKCSEDKPCPERPVDCEELQRSGQWENGVYTIWPRTRIHHYSGGLEVYCDMETDGGGWTVIQRRGNFGKSPQYFYQNWEAYKEGFGDVKQDFWLGNDNLFAVSNQRQYSLRFDMADLQEEKRYAVYDTFWVGGPDYNYTLHVKGYSGTAGDSFGGHSNHQFSTFDRDNDGHATSSCAAMYKGGWWYTACHSSNLNGLYLNGEHPSYADGVEWKTWTGYNYSLPWTEMKLRPINHKR